MSSITQSSGLLAQIAFAAVCVGCNGSALMAAEHANTVDNPYDPAAAVPKASYQSVLPGTNKGYLQKTDEKRLPWRSLFTPTGDFAPQGDSPEVRPAEEQSTPTEPRTVPSAAGDSDAHGVVKSIDYGRLRVKLKHGPIARLEMPGMTMVFRVRDPSLLDQVKKGDSVGFTVEVEGSAFFVTGFQK